jgi:hypothetical protein
MAQNVTTKFDADVWTQLTDADVTKITFQNRGPDTILVQVTASAVAPTGTDGAIRYDRLQGEAGILLSDLQPGVASGVRVYVQPEGNTADVFVSHA